MNKDWPITLPCVQIRIARPTNKLNEEVKFYIEGLGLKKIGSFTAHNGYDGIMIGLPNSDYHLEFTTHIDGSPCPAPSKDNLLVFYISDEDAIAKKVEHLQKMDYFPVEPENPYWKEKGKTFEDPDGWRIVLFNHIF